MLNNAACQCNMHSTRTPAMSLFLWLYASNLIVVTLACNQTGYTLVPEDVYDKNLVYCAGSFEDTSSYTKLHKLLSQDSVIGIYKTSNTVAQLCFSSPGIGRSTLGSFSGGTPYLLGKSSILTITSSTIQNRFTTVNYVTEIVNLHHANKWGTCNAYNKSLFLHHFILWEFPTNLPKTWVKMKWIGNSENQIYVNLSTLLRQLCYETAVTALTIW